jgi:hypothetical protein
MIARSLCVAAALTATVAVCAPAASAEPAVPDGAYAIRYADGESGAWVFTPCGPDCTTANSPGDPFVTDWRFHLADGRWTYSGPNQLDCPSGGGSAPIAMVYGFDAVSLTGQAQATLATDTCGTPAGKTMVRPFQLTRTG